MESSMIVKRPTADNPNKSDLHPKAKEAGYDKPNSSDPKISGWQRIRDDFRRKRFVPLKLLFIVIFSSIGVLLPYMTIHMKSLGITIEESAIIYGVFPVFGVLAPPAMGLIADKIGNFKIFLSGMLVICGANALLFLTIPAARFTTNHPGNLSLFIECNPDQEYLKLIGTDFHECQLIDALPQNLSFALGACNFRCFSDNSQAYQLETNRIENWTIDISACDEQFPSVDCVVLKSDTGSEKNKRVMVNELEHLDNNALIVKSFLMDGQTHSKVKCVPMSYQWELNFTSLSYPLSEKCQASCTITVPRNSICINSQTVTTYDPEFTFWTYLMLRIFLTITFGGSMVLFDGAVMAIITEYKGDLGLQRLYGVIGLTIFAPFSGFLIDTVSVDPNYPDFRPAFYMFAALLVCGAVLIMTLTLDFKPPAEKLLTDIWLVLANVELDVFLLISFLSGAYWGYIESYLFWFLEDMGGTKSLMGLTLAVSALSGIPCLILASPIAKKIGHPNIQVMGFAFYVVRFIGYSYIYDPYMCLIFETMEAVTTALMTTSACSYAADLSKPSTLASIQGLVSGCYYGIGRAAGSLLGGYLMKWVGTRTTFRLLGIASFVTGASYFLFSFFYLRPKYASSNNEPSREVNDTVTFPVTKAVKCLDSKAPLKKTATGLGQLNRGYTEEENVENGLEKIQESDAPSARLEKDIINTVIDQEARLHTNDQLHY